ncbi:hypothetical protein BSY15_2472 [Acidovorax sp. RAC01]|nr:hypothetical protein BSY15_2472 [Acidovorax sp. RAC01]
MRLEDSRLRSVCDDHKGCLSQKCVGTPLLFISWLYRKSFPLQLQDRKRSLMLINEDVCAPFHVIR